MLRLGGLWSFSQCEVFQRLPLSSSRPPFTPQAVRGSKQALLFKDGGQQREVEGGELHAGPVVELVLKLHPETERAGEETGWWRQSRAGWPPPTSEAAARAGTPISPP